MRSTTWFFFDFLFLETLRSKCESILNDEWNQIFKKKKKEERETANEKYYHFFIATDSVVFFCARLSDSNHKITFHKKQFVKRKTSEKKNEEKKEEEEMIQRAYSDRRSEHGQMNIRKKEGKNEWMKEEKVCSMLHEISPEIDKNLHLKRCSRAAANWLKQIWIAWFCLSILAVPRHHRTTFRAGLFALTFSRIHFTT